VDKISFIFNLRQDQPQSSAWKVSARSANSTRTGKPTPDKCGAIGLWALAKSKAHVKQQDEG
jgi:hypothetical protein